ncbi:MAG: hypothetical protein GDA50_07620 [Alphaproteobacteria bacterium GM202ARS2]|nr:hypothetical protein [Alphaproteobacteria bacterium GM202ARS2]
MGQICQNGSDGKDLVDLDTRPSCNRAQLADRPPSTNNSTPLMNEAEMNKQSDQGDDTDKRALAAVGEPRQVQPAAVSRLTQEEFQGLADVPPEVEWFANIRNKNTKRA